MVKKMKSQKNHKDINCFSKRKEKANQILSLLKSINNIELEENSVERISIWLEDYRQNNTSLDFKENSFKKELFELIDKHIYAF